MTERYTDLIWWNNFTDGSECVIDVFLWSKAHDTRRLFVLQTEEFEFLTV